MNSHGQNKIKSLLLWILHVSGEDDMKEITRDLCPVVKWVKLSGDDLTRKNERKQGGQQEEHGWCVK